MVECEAAVFRGVRTCTKRMMRRISEHARRKPDGGFCFVPAMAFMAAWWAYRRGFLRVGDLRVWLASFEVVARRSGSPTPRRPCYAQQELASLTGMQSAEIQGALRRLESAGLLVWSESAIRFGEGTEALRDHLAADLSDAAENLVNSRRKVPLPRRVLRYLCHVRRPVVWATTVGHALRCLYYRNSHCCPDGRCKASWIAGTFDVNLRNTKEARRALVAQGMLIVDLDHQCAMNRWGARVRFDLTWRDAERATSLDPPPPGGALRVEKPPPTNRELATRVVNPKPGGRNWALHRCSSWCITPDDLQEPVQLQQRFEQLVQLRVCRPGPASRLAFFAAAARAKRVATTNAPGLLATLVRRGLWRFASLEDEDRARSWLSSFDHPETSDGAPARRVRLRGSVAEVASSMRPPEPASAILSRLSGRIGLGTGDLGPPGRSCVSS